MILQVRIISLNVNGIRSAARKGERFSGRAPLKMEFRR
jgi:hypothetical protein